MIDRFGSKHDFEPILNFLLWMLSEIYVLIKNWYRRELVKRINRNDHTSDRFAVKARLNLNELLRRRTEEKKIDKKTNLIIFSSAAAVAMLVLLILNI